MTSTFDTKAVNSLLISAFVVCATLASMAPSALAAPIHVTNVQVPYYEGITLSGGLLGSSPVNVGIAGQIVLTTDAGVLGGWCVDYFHEIYIGGTYTYTAGPLVTDNSGSTAGTSNALTATQIQQIGSLAAYGNALMHTAPTNWDSAAIQAAIWNVEYGTTAAGSTNFMASLANINVLLPTLAPAYGVQLSNTNGDAQFLSQGQYTTDVSEPAPFAILGTGLLGLGMLRRRA